MVGGTENLYDLRQLVQAVTNGWGSGGITTTVSSIVAMSVAGAYTTGDYIGTSITPQFFPLAVKDRSKTGIIKTITIADKTTTTAVDLELWLFTTTFVAPTDNAAWAISDAEVFTCIGIIPIEATASANTGWYASSNNKVYFDGTQSVVIKPNTTSLYYALVAKGSTPTWTSGDLQITLGILQD